MDIETYMKEAGVWRSTFVVSALGRLRPKFKASLGCSVGPCLRKEKAGKQEDQAFRAVHSCIASSRPALAT